MLKRFFKKVVNKVKEVVNMAVSAVVEREETKKAAIAEVVIHTEDLLAEGVKGAVKLGKDTVKGAINLKKEKVEGLSNTASKIKHNSGYIGIVSIGTCIGLGVGICAVGLGVGVSLILAEKKISMR